jgi:branched-chain amino acid transport system substrate-binding protein
MHQRTKKWPVSFPSYPRAQIVSRDIIRETSIFFTLLIIASLNIPPAYAEDTSAPSPPAPIRLGVSLPLTGDGASFGADARSGIQLALDDIGKEKYQVIWEDDKCDALQGVTVAQKLVNVDKVDYVTGFMCSTAALAAGPIYEGKKVPMMVVGASSPRLTKKGDTIFRSMTNDKHTARLLSQYVARQGLKKIGILSAQSAYCLDLRDAFTHEVGVDKVVSEEYGLRTTDFKSMLLSMKAKDIDALFINSNLDTDYVVVLKQIKSLRWNVPLLGAYYPGLPSVLALPKSLTEGIVFSDLPSEDAIRDPKGKDVLKRMRDRFGPAKANPVFPLLAYEAVVAFDHAIESGKDIGEYLNNRSFEGAIGTYSFDENGDMQGLPYELKKVVDGGSVVVNYPAS